MINEKFNVIIFSKDRPWQLGQLLSSIFTYTDFNRIFVILKMRDPYIKNYKKIISLFKDRVEFIIEVDSFKETFFNVLNKCEHNVSFMVDDVVFFDSFSAKSAVDFMEREPIISYQFKMNSNYTICQPAGKEQMKPRSLKKIDEHWVWEDKDGNWDWDYPFDLTGSMYLKNDMNSIFDDIYKSEIINPNYLEGAGAVIFVNKKIEELGKKYMACQDKRVCACLALNHVNPRKNAWSVNPQSALDYFNKSVFGKYNYDHDFIKNYDQKSVHITKYKLKPI